MKLTSYPTSRTSRIEWAPMIPPDWDECSAKINFSMQLGKMLQNDPSELKDVEIAYLKALHVNWNRVTTEDLPKMWASPSEVDQYAVSDGDLLVSEGGEVGRAAIIKNLREPAIIQNALHRVRDTARGDVRYFAYLLRHIADSGWFAILCNKATIAHLTCEKLGAIRMPVPSVSEQKQIAAFLDWKIDEIDVLISRKQALLEKLKEKRMAVITQGVIRGFNADATFRDSGVTWLGHVPEHWEVKRLKFSVSKAGSGITPKGGAESYELTGIPLLRSQNIHFEGLHMDDIVFISEETHLEMSNSQVAPGDVLLNITGASIGRCNYADETLGEANVNQHVCIIRPEIVLETKYLYYLLWSEIGRLQIQLEQDGSGREGLNFVSIKNFLFPLPPLKEQQEIVAQLDKQLDLFKSLVTVVESAIAKLSEYRTALITAATTGKIDVRNVKIPPHRSS